LIIAVLAATMGPLPAEDSAADANNAKDPMVKVLGAAGNRTLSYAEHVLSCGTHMNGALKESTKGRILSVKGSFPIKENPYGNAKLDVNISKPKGGGKRKGYLVVDRKSVPVELVQ